MASALAEPKIARMAEGMELSQVHRGQGPPGEPDLQAQGVRPIRAERVFIKCSNFLGKLELDKKEKV